MTRAAFRKIALSMPHAVESGHMGHPDFRVKKKIFATLIERDGVDWGVLKFSPTQQQEWMESDPAIYEPVPGGWGKKGYTQVLLKSAKPASLKRAMFTAWLNAAPPSLRR